jgi:hypothetical protein
LPSSRQTDQTKRGHQVETTSQRPRPAGASSGAHNVNVSVEHTDRLLGMVRDQLLREFPDSNLTVVQLALETCSFNESKARQLLKAFNSTSQPTTTLTTATTSTSHTATNELANSEYSAAASVIRGIFSSQCSNTTVGGATSGTKSMPGPTFSYPGYMHESAGSLPHRNIHKEHSTEHRCLAKGPDTSLAGGPNKKLLLSDYLPSQGAEPSLHVGPDPTNHLGPCPSLHVGPQSSLIAGKCQAIP